MRLSPGTVESRREFLRSAGRHGLLAVLAVVGVLSVRKSGLSGQRCINRGICGDCGVFATCGLPQALSAKEAGERNRNGGAK